MVGRLEHLALTCCGQHQIILRLDACRGQALQLQTQRRIVAGQASGIDQHHAFLGQRRQSLQQRLTRVDLSHRHAENAPQGLELLLCADAKAVHAHQSDLLRAVLKHITRSQLGQGSGLAHAGRANQRDHTTLFQRLDLGRSDRVSQMRQQHAPGLTRLGHTGHLAQQRLR